MRFVSIAQFLFMIHVAMALVNATLIFETNLNPANSWFDEVGKEELQTEAYIQNQVDTNVGYDLGDVVKGLLYFVVSFAATIFVFPFTLIQFGVPAIYAGIVSLPLYLIYLFGLTQWIANRQEKGMG